MSYFSTKALCRRLAPRLRLAVALLALSALLSIGVGGCTTNFSGPGEPPCGNGALDEGEECDATDLDGATCDSLGYGGGTLTCGLDCLLVVEACEEAGFCGDGHLEPTQEECDASLLGGATCETLGLGAGQVTCDGSCLLDTSDCAGICGDNILQPAVGEVCDGPELGGATCAGLGFIDGEVACTADCTELDVGGCTPQATGAPCDDDIQCAGKVCYSETGDGWPDGTCTRDCDATSCVAPAECIDHGNGDRRCYQSCVDYLDCRPGYACFDRWVTGTSYCHPLCSTDADCPDTGFCNPYSRLCGAPEVGGDYGAPCTLGTECLGGACLLFPDGYCTSMCSLTDGLCPAGTSSVCVDMGLGSWGDLGLCMPTCSGNGDCPRSGYHCDSTYLSPQDICAPG